MIHLVDADADFAAAFAPAQRPLAAQVLRLPRIDVPRGVWSGPPVCDATLGPVGLIVVDGLLARNLHAQDRTATELFGPGDFLDSGSPEGLGEDADVAVEWVVHQVATLAILDDRFITAAGRWPILWTIIFQRMSARGNRLAMHVLALQRSRVESRVVEVMWQLAERWGGA